MNECQFKMIDYKNVVILALLAIMVVGLSGCGRRGDLQAPGAQQNQNSPSTAPSDEVQPAPKPDRKFILDGLI